MAWVSYFDQSISIGGSRETGYVPFLIDGLTSKRLVIEASNPAAAATWRTAFRILFFQEFADFPGGSARAEFYSGKVLLNRKTLLSPPFSWNTLYQVQLLIPWWHEQLQINIWQEVRASDYNRSVRSTFTQADLSAEGVLHLSHNLEASPVISTLWDDTGDRIMPDDIDYPSTDSIEITLESFAPISGTWTVEIGD